MNEQEFIAKVTEALDEGAGRLTSPTVEALRAGRRRALAGRRQRDAGGAHAWVAVLGWAHHHSRMFWLLLLLAVLLGMVGYQMLNDQDASDLDIQLLTDDLPPQAYLHGDMGSWLNAREQ